MENSNQLTDEDQRVLAAVAMGLVRRDITMLGSTFLYYVDCDPPRGAAETVRRLMAKQLVAYTNGKLQPTNR